jgi:hypothetical protein
MNNMDNPSAFSQEQVVSEPTEIEKIQNRVNNFEVGLKPATAEAVNGVLGIALSKGLFGVDDLEAIIAIREDIKKGLIAYQTTVTHAQRDLENAQQNLLIQQQQEVEIEKERQRAKLTEERLLRKASDARLAQMEQALANQGLHIDLDGDGVIGLKDGQVVDTLSAQEQAEVNAMLTPVVQTQPDPNHQTSGAFKLARMMNPATEETEEPTEFFTNDPALAEKIEDTKTAFKDWDANTVAGEDTTSFMQEVAKVEALSNISEEEDVLDASGMYDDEEELPMDNLEEEPTLDIGYDNSDEITRRERVLLDPLGASERSDEINAQIPTPQNVTAPFITGGNAPNLTQPQEPVTRTPLADGVYVEHTESEIMQDELEPIPAPVLGENDIVINSDNIKSFGEFSDLETEPQEEEFDEVVIPNRTDLDAMTKKDILKSATALSFTIDSKLTKPLMIDSFETQANTLIEELTGGNDFVSTSEEDLDGNDDRRDGGYF